MTVQPPYRATISPVSWELQRPLWSVMIPTFNCANYLRETLESVLVQDPGIESMQIEVVDDHSTQDDPAAVAAEVGQGRVGFYRQPVNVGHVKNFQTCLERSRGQLIHILHGDDCVRDGFYRKLQQGFAEQPDIGAAFCRHLWMDEQSHWQRISALEQSESGVLSDWLAKIATGQRIQTPAIVVKREVYERLGGFDRRLLWAEDWEMWVRIAAHYPIWYEVEPLALYRVHSTSNSGRYLRTGENMQDFRRAIEVVRAYLPSHLPQTTAQRCLKENRQNLAYYALGNAQQMLMIGDRIAVVRQLWEALRCKQSLGVLCTVLSLLGATGKLWFQHHYRVNFVNKDSSIEGSIERSNS
jgi:glycosyltransferase involved in cell wall biosynthesis